MKGDPTHENNPDPFPLSLSFPLPDTGQTKCYDNTAEIPCPKPGEPFYGQDASYTGPRSYTKLGTGGAELPDSAAAGVKTPVMSADISKDGKVGLAGAIYTT